ncbi:hypothetical protein NC653_013414 [Populus alba x Populus x berolinensis]|uniref:Uncharacterized protein n=1 Tax=Populus alba x Populus x berolinensis TaxID=444605 RepID=A0AAD6QUJ3_9ROSI|nr:hypothetical protein NC653_013414 [Populus alba x Populus x berolinensis]
MSFRFNLFTPDTIIVVLVCHFDSILRCRTTQYLDFDCRFHSSILIPISLFLFQVIYSCLSSNISKV